MVKGSMPANGWAVSVAFIERSSGGGLGKRLFIIMGEGFLFGHQFQSECPLGGGHRGGEDRLKRPGA